MKGTAVCVTLADGSVHRFTQSCYGKPGLFWLHIIDKDTDEKLATFRKSKVVSVVIEK